MGAVCRRLFEQTPPDKHPQRPRWMTTMHTTTPGEEEQEDEDITMSPIVSAEEMSRSTSSIALYPLCLSDDEVEVSQLAGSILQLESPQQSMNASSSALIEFALDALLHQEDTLRLTEQNLFPLKGWLEKKQSSPPYFWQKRYVVVQDGYLLWSDREMSIENGVTDEEKRRWSKHINLRRIESVTAIECKKQRKFALRRKNAKRDCIWRAQSKDWRDDYWIKGMNERMDYARQKSLFR